MLSVLSHRGLLVGAVAAILLYAHKRSSPVVSQNHLSHTDRPIDDMNRI